MKRIPPTDGEVKDAIEYPFIPPGEYEATYKTHALFKMYGGAHKLRVFFTVTDDDDRNAFGLSVPWFSNITITSMKNHSWTAGKRTKFMETFCSLFHEYNPRRQKRIPMDKFKGKAFRIKVVTVNRNRNKDERPESLHYSKVLELRNVL